MVLNTKCDETCKGGSNCANSRIYVSGLPKGASSEHITDIFCGIGKLARERPQGRGVFPDMMPFRVKFYGNNDCLLQYEDSHAAHAAPSFFDGYEMKGCKLHVEMAEKKPNQGLDPADVAAAAQADAEARKGKESSSSSRHDSDRPRGDRDRESTRDSDRRKDSDRRDRDRDSDRRDRDRDRDRHRDSDRRDRRDDRRRSRSRSRGRR